MIRIYRFRHHKRVLYGVERVGEADGTVEVIRGTPFRSLKTTGEVLNLSDVTLLAPCEPSKIVAVALNYRDHAIERNRPLPSEPVLFIKPPSAVIGPGDEIIYPRMSRRVDFEGEMGIVIRRRARHLAEDEPVEPYVLGYTCVNDVTARDLQEKDVQYGRAKGFDTFAPIGPAIASGLDAGNLAIETRLNGKVHQSSNTRNMVFAPDHLVRFVSQVMTLEPGDVISTGTPSGIGPMSAGDRVEVQIEGIGTLVNMVMKVREA